MNTQRVQAVRRLGLMDTEPEERFDRICRLASHIAGTPVAYVSLLDDTKQFYKAAVGLGGVRETALEDSFCLHTTEAEETVHVPDATRDERFCDNRFVVGPPGVRSYLGEPLFSPDGHAVGTFCLIDLQPRDFEPEVIALCKDLAALAQRELHLVTQLRLQQRLKEFTGGLSHSLEVREVGESLLAMLQDFVPCSYSCVLVDEGGGLRPAASLGREQQGVRLEVTIQSGANPWGRLVLERDRVTGFSESEESLLEAFASQAGLILDNRHGLSNLIEQSRLASLGTLAAGVAHELNSPLGAARLNVESVRKSLDAGQSKLIRRLERTETALKKAGQIVHNVLSYAGENSSKLKHSELDLVVTQTVELLNHEFRDAGVELQMQLASNVATPMGSEELHRVVHHLLDNALKALGDRDQAVRRVVVRTVREGSQARLFVEDNGPGIPVELAPRIFDPFFTTRDPGQGVGLGLSVSRQLVRALGGEISLRPSTEGAVFQVSLPVS